MGAGTVVAQTSISTQGAIESQSGGFIFPDGTVQMTAAAGGAPVADTGQIWCFDEDGIRRACAATGEDGEHQAGVAWPTPRFTDNGDGTVTDNLTGLIWLKDANCPAATKTWQQALGWVDDLNTMSIACTGYAALTHKDWRLPNVRELPSLIDYGASGPALPEGHPFVNVQSSFYWSSSFLVTSPSVAWIVVLDDGQLGIDLKVNSNSVWPVRSGK